LNGAVTITGAPVAIEATHDVIVRFIRFRKSPDDNLRIVGACRHIVIDHCSSTSAGDGALDITIDYDKPKQRPADITVSWCIFAGTKKAMLISNADNISLHHNMFLDNEMRNPQLHDARNFDFRNNVIYHWGVYGLRARAGTTGNVMYNFLGPSSNPRKNQKLALVLMGKEEAKIPVGPIHVAGNLGPGKLNLNPAGTAPKAIRAPTVTVWNPAQAYRYVIQHAGARPLDKVDLALLKGL
jgi:pectate lyase